MTSCDKDSYYYGFCNVIQTSSPFHRWCQLLTGRFHQPNCKTILSSVNTHTHTHTYTHTHIHIHTYTHTHIHTHTQPHIHNHTYTHTHTHTHHTPHTFECLLYSVWLHEEGFYTLDDVSAHHGGTAKCPLVHYTDVQGRSMQLFLRQQL